MTTQIISRQQRAVRVGLWIGCGMMLAITLFLLLSYQNRRDQLERGAFDSAQAQAESAKIEIDRIFGEIMTIAEGIAADLSQGTLAYGEIDQRLRAEMEARPDLDGLAVTFQPYVYDPDERLYQTYHYRGADASLAVLSGATYDYTIPPGSDPGAPQTAWYHHPLENGAVWNEPFLATGAGKVLIEYGLPFFRSGEQDGEPAGVVTIDYSLQGMRDLMASLELGATGYGYIIAPSGTFLAHPVQDLVAHSSIFELAESLENDGLERDAQRALAGESFSTSDADPVTGQSSWIFYEYVPVTGWVLGLVLNKAEFLPGARATLQEQVTIALAAGAFITLFAALVLRVERGTRRSLWALSFVFALVCTGLIVLTWFAASSYGGNGGVAVTSQAAVERYLESYRERLTVADPPIVIPTGVLVQALDFPDATSVTLNGYIWQRYPHAAPETLIRGFTLPQRIGEEATLDEVQRVAQGDEELIIWYFGVTLKQTFNPTQFPFDSRDVRVHLAPADLNHSIVLAPDLASYDLINPLLRPGVDEGVSINNWRVESSLFSYRPTSPMTSLGLISRVERSNHPELFFTISTRRNFVGPFIAYLLPGIVAAGMLFAFLLNDRQPGDKEEVVTALNYAAALFFVIAVTHTALRDSIAAVEITYMEYLFILLYLAIIGVAVNTFFVVRTPRILQFIRFRDNFMVKLLYWPVMIGLLLVATLFTFVFN